MRYRGGWATLGLVAVAGMALGAAATSAPEAVQVVRREVADRALREPRAASGAARFASLARDADFVVVAAERDGPGKAELHDRDTDVWYVVSGAGTLVTGGSLVDPAVAGPGERRGSSIRDGQAHALAAGDVITIRRGVPHWVSSVEGQLRYLTVKIHR